MPDDINWCDNIFGGADQVDEDMIETYFGQKLFRDLNVPVGLIANDI